VVAWREGRSDVGSEGGREEGREGGREEGSEGGCTYGEKYQRATDPAMTNC